MWDSLDGLCLSIVDEILAGFVPRSGNALLDCTSARWSDTPFALLALEPVQNLFEQQSQNARWTNCKLVPSNLCQFFHNRLFFSVQAKLRSTTTLGHHLERMQFTALGDLYRDVSAQNVLDALGKRSAHIAAVTQQGLHPAKAGLQRCSAQGTFAVRYLGRGHRNSVR